MNTTMQQEYERLINNLRGYPEDVKTDLIKSVSATKTALDALDSKILDDKVSAALGGFLGVLTALNDILCDINSSPAGTVLAIEYESTKSDPVPAKRKKPAKNTDFEPESSSVEGDI